MADDVQKKEEIPDGLGTSRQRGQASSSWDNRGTTNGGHRGPCIWIVLKRAQHTVSPRILEAE